MAMHIQTRSGGPAIQRGVPVGVKMLPTMIDQVDALIQGDKTRSDVLRELIAEALRYREYERALVEQYEREQKQELPDAA